MSKTFLKFEIIRAGNFFPSKYNWKCWWRFSCINLLRRYCCLLDSHIPHTHCQINNVKLMFMFSAIKVKMFNIMDIMETIFCDKTATIFESLVLWAHILLCVQYYFTSAYLYFSRFLSDNDSFKYSVRGGDN